MATLVIGGGQKWDIGTGELEEPLRPRGRMRVTLRELERVRHRSCRVRMNADVRSCGRSGARRCSRGFAIDERIVHAQLHDSCILWEMLGAARTFFYFVSTRSKTRHGAATDLSCVPLRRHARRHTLPQA